MPPFLTEQIQQFGQRVGRDAPASGTDWARLAEDVAEMAALAVYLLERVERVAGAAQPPPPAPWDAEAARPFVPLFRQWFGYATHVLELARACKAHGHPAEGVHDFVHAYNRSKLMVEFDRTAEAYRRFQRGEKGRPLEEVMDELRRRDRPAGG